MIAFQDIQFLLQQHHSRFEEENFFRKTALDFVAAQSNQCWQRQNPAGHITASAWVLDPVGQQALLIHHRTLDKWFQPGGHIEPDDTSLLAAARRELIEECGLKDAKSISDAIFDLDIHLIPAKGEMPEHPHFDIRFLFQGDPEQTTPNLSEVRALQWYSLKALLEMPLQQSVRRMVLKTK
jgi:8-oxo-dGTP pyrophosphatase MutT (NUDIX family)